MSILRVLTLVFLCLPILAHTSVKADSNPTRQGPRLLGYQDELKKVFPEANRFEEQVFVPKNSGGVTFIGLVRRLLGTGTHRTFEGLDTNRFIYKAYKDKEVLGVAHGSEYDLKDNRNVTVFVFYTAGGAIKELRADGVPSETLASLHSGAYLSQFLGHKTEDFEVRLNRRGRAIQKGLFIQKRKQPKAGSSRNFFDAIYRAVRFNAAFMDVAFFITQHPNLDQKSTPLKVGIPLTGPEAFVRDHEDQEKNKSKNNE